METLLIVALVAYGLIGLVVYLVTDTSSVAWRIESMLVVVPFGVIENHLFLFVVALWPLWLVALLSGKPPPR